MVTTSSAANAGLATIAAAARAAAKVRIAIIVRVPMWVLPDCDSLGCLRDVSMTCPRTKRDRADFDLQLSDFVRGGFDDIDRSVELSLFNRQGRAKRYDPARPQFEAEATDEAGVEQPVGVRFSGGACQFECETEADAAHSASAEDGVALRDLRKSFEAVPAERRGTHQQSFLRYDVEGGECGGGAERALLMRVVADGRPRCHVELTTGDDRGRRHEAAALTFSDDKNIPCRAALLEREHRSGAAETARNLVEDKQGAVAVAACAHARQEVRGRRRDRGPTHRLRNHGGDIALLVQDAVYVVGKALMSAAIFTEEADGPVQRRHVLTAR